MEFSTEITIMGRSGDKGLLGAAGETAARKIQKFCDDSTIFMQDAKSFATAVIARADGGKIKRLNIIDHGNETGCYFGDDLITTKTFADYAAYLAKVNLHLTRDAIVFLRHCYMGLNPDLMKMFAMVFGVRVYAGTSVEASGPFNHNWGDYVGCTPGGTMFKEMKRP